MLYDLNIPWSPTTSPADLARTISFASSLGYTVLALNHTITPPIPSQITNPLPKFPSQSTTTAIPSPPTGTTSQPPQQQPSKQPTILHRATVTLSDPSQNYRLPTLALAYDILAVRPTTEKAFQAACLSMAEPSLISLDLTQHFPFHFRPKPLMAAVARGVKFEVCYAQVLASSSSSSSASGGGIGPPPDARARATFISNFASLVRATKGRGIVVSSEARGALGLRAPNDVVNLLAVWGLGSERGTEALGVNPRGVVVNEGIKRSGFRGVVNVLEVGGRESDVKKNQQQQQQGKKGKKQQGGGAGGGGGDKGNAQKRKTPDEGGDGAQPTVSKRQAKKLRLALKEQEKEAS
ncbi:RNase P subunit p30 [Colletotrichum scovillei]|uniref:RNase P subunit p30 n=1 Tax=Colletotrichum scovillei TaxID=1209932 RepID=A0A9P7QX97_9PEZI|nr:RNase P subunit p30 [Colletotrichum scovillei]KAF4784715.1 RNase P subunit p30 [Colletotrichum scovillei]KAG7044888.1 RNase P subunit p30 [Colletotrichum scovillei]KAG7049601.1 RNase P subunit p30 [Colletotrichum scovillei]KAG7064341.1 RNase P subunit p30 [Colletotrichum scovillei]